MCDAEAVLTGVGVVEGLSVVGDGFEVEGFDEDELDVEALSSAYVNANDVPGLVAAVLNHGRQLLQPR